MTSQIADYATLIGLPITIIGLVVALLQIRKVKKSSELSTLAIKGFRKDLTNYNTIGLFAETLTSISEIKKLIRTNSYIYVPDKLHEVRLKILSIQESNIEFNRKQTNIFRDAISTFSLLESNYEHKLDNDDGSVIDTKVLDSIAEQSATLKSVQIQIRKIIEENHGKK